MTPFGAVLTLTVATVVRAEVSITDRVSSFSLVTYRRCVLGSTAAYCGSVTDGDGGGHRVAGRVDHRHRTRLRRVEVILVGWVEVLILVHHVE